jgi:hypothetical protein
MDYDYAAKLSAVEKQLQDLDNDDTFKKPRQKIRTMQSFTETERDAYNEFKSDVDRPREEEKFYQEQIRNQGKFIFDRSHSHPSPQAPVPTLQSTLGNIDDV